MAHSQGKLFEALLGAVVLAVATFFFVFAYIKSNQTLSSGYPLTARFDHVDGLSVGCTVNLNGVKVGKVQEITLDPQNYLALVTFDVRDGLRIPKNSTAQIISDGLLGGKTLSITPGSDRDFLEAGQEIEDTQSSVNLESLLSKFVFSVGNSEKK